MEPQYNDQALKPTASAQSLFSNYQIKAPTTNARTEREDFTQMFCDQINIERDGKVYKPITFVGVKTKLAHLQDWEVKWFYKQCSNARSFSAFFFWSLKVKK